jgi:hypothetical protein
MEDKLNEIWDYIELNGIATNEELRLVTCINGYNEKSLNDIIYARTGYHSVEQIEECEGEDETN